MGQRAKEEVRITLTHAGFEKSLFIDLVVDNSSPFELKVVSQFHNRHRSQLIQYMMLAGLYHGKMMNFGADQFEHEFVNCRETPEHRRQFQVDLDRWSHQTADARNFRAMVTELSADWGTGLEQSLYEETITFLLGGRERVCKPVETHWQGHVISRQYLNLFSANTAFNVTCLRKNRGHFECNLRAVLANTDLDRIFWANATSGKISFVLLTK